MVSDRTHASERVATRDLTMQTRHHRAGMLISLSQQRMPTTKERSVRAGTLTEAIWPCLRQLWTYLSRRCPCLAYALVLLIVTRLLGRLDGIVATRLPTARLETSIHISSEKEQQAGTCPICHSRQRRLLGRIKARVRRLSSLRVVSLILLTRAELLQLQRLPKCKGYHRSRSLARIVQARLASPTLPGGSMSLVRRFET